MEFKKSLCFVVVVSTIVIIIALLTASMKKLATHEVGLIYDTIWKKLKDEPLSEGLYTGRVQLTDVRLEPLPWEKGQRSCKLQQLLQLPESATRLLSPDRLVD